MVKNILLISMTALALSLGWLLVIYRARIDFLDAEVRQQVVERLEEARSCACFERRLLIDIATKRLCRE